MKHIFIHAKEWLDRTYGNSYFSIRFTVDDSETIALPIQCGYGDHYIDVVGQYLIEHGYTDVNIRRWSDVEKHGIKVQTVKESNCLKRDVKAWGAMK